MATDTSGFTSPLNTRALAIRTSSLVIGYADATRLAQVSGRFSERRTCITFTDVYPSWPRWTGLFVADVIGRLEACCIYTKCAEPNGNGIARTRTSANCCYGLTAGPPPVAFAPCVRAGGYAVLREPESRETRVSGKNEMSSKAVSRWISLGTPWTFRVISPSRLATTKK